LLGWLNAFVFGFHPAWLSPSLVASSVLSSDLLSVTRAGLLRVVTTLWSFDGTCEETIETTGQRRVLKLRRLGRR
jgi:hypothetical protein